MVPNLFLLLFIAISFVISFFFVRLTISISTKTGFVSKSNPIVKNHVKAVAYGGGIAFVFAIILEGLVLYFAKGSDSSLWLWITPVFVVGLIDDISPFKPLNKLMLMAVCTLPYIILDKWSLIYLPALLLFLLTAQNAWNLVDVMDGLLGWITLTAFLVIATAVFVSGIPLNTVMATALISAAAIGGFLVWNSNPAKIFMGDAGSLTLGMLWGMIILEIAKVNLLLAFLLLPTGVIPAFELLFLVIVRTKKGIAFYKGSPDHFALRLLNHGHSVKKIVTFVILFQVLAGAVTVAIAKYAFTTRATILFISVMFLIALYAFKYFNSLTVYEVKK